ncbi:MAG: response regulator transcription factor [Chloroflexi bacterium]|nr:response regulator transcription factor [Chloroflexota bacterium]
MKIRILLIDDDAFNLEGLKTYLFSKGYDVHTAQDMVKARQLFKTMLFSAVIVDARLPEDISLVRPKMQASGGMTLIREFKQHSPHLGVVLFTAHDDFGGEFADLLHTGVRGIAYVLKGRSISHLMRALYDAMEGRGVIDPDVVDVPEWQRNVISNLPSDEAHWVKAILTNLVALSPQERIVAERLAASQKINYIAEQMNLDPKTIYTHKTRLLSKLGLNEAPPHLDMVLLLSKALWLV